MCLYIDKAWRHRADAVHRARWARVRHLLMSDRHRQRCNADDGAHRVWPNAIAWAADGRAAHGRQSCRPADTLYVQSSPGIECAVRNHHGDEDAIHRPRVTTRLLAALSI